MPSVGHDNEVNRQAWLAQRLAALPAGTQLLDAGAGELRQKQHCGHMIYTSQDFAQYDGRGDGTGLHMGSWDQSKLDIVSDITAIPRPDASFDAIMCVEVFEHLPDPVGALREFNRLLRPGGTAILTAPFWSMTHFAPYHFAGGFNRYWYEHHLGKLGFDVVELTPNGNYFDNIAQEIWRIPSMAQKYAGLRSSPFIKLAARFVLRFLAKASRHDSGSAALLCYGYHVMARKRMP